MQTELTIETEPCEAPGCTEPSTWWTCSRCGAHCCQRHQTFTGMIVPTCSCCLPTLWERFQRVNALIKRIAHANRTDD